MNNKRKRHIQNLLCTEKEKPKLSTNYCKMFQELEFENNIDNQVGA
jgi:hypothetical protein